MEDWSRRLASRCCATRHAAESPEGQIPDQRSSPAHAGHLFVTHGTIRHSTTDVISAVAARHTLFPDHERVLVSCPHNLSAPSPPPRPRMKRHWPALIAVGEGGCRNRPAQAWRLGPRSVLDGLEPVGQLGDLVIVRTADQVVNVGIR